MGVFGFLAKVLRCSLKYKQVGLQPNRSRILSSGLRPLPPDPFRPLRLPKAVICKGWRLHFGTLGDHCGTLGSPWEAMGAARRTHGGPESDFLRV